MQIRLCVAAGVLIVAVPSSAHHSAPAHYVMDQSVSVEGTVVEFLWRNPHSFLHIEVSNESGALDIWALELHNTIMMARAGYSPGMFQPGDEVSAAGSPSRDGTRRLQAHFVRRLSDGFEYLDPTRGTQQ